MVLDRLDLCCLGRVKNVFLVCGDFLQKFDSPLLILDGFGDAEVPKKNFPDEKHDKYGDSEKEYQV